MCWSSFCVRYASKTPGLTLFAFAIWLPLMCFHELPYNQPFLWGVALIFTAASIGDSGSRSDLSFTCSGAWPGQRTKSFAFISFLLICFFHTRPLPLRRASPRQHASSSPPPSPQQESGLTAKFEAKCAFPHAGSSQAPSTSPVTSQIRRGQPSRICRETGCNGKCPLDDCWY